MCCLPQDHVVPGDELNGSPPAAEVQTFSSHDSISDRSGASIRDRTLVLRILVPRLEARLRDKMKDRVERADETQQYNAAAYLVNLILPLLLAPSKPAALTWTWKASAVLRLTVIGRGGRFIAMAKTIRHASLIFPAPSSCTRPTITLPITNVAMQLALEEAAEAEKIHEGFPSYYPSGGLTPPTKRIVEKRFAAREHNAVAPPRAAVADVEVELIELMDKLAKDDNKANNRRKSKLPAAVNASKVLEEVVEEIADYEPWMENFVREPLDPLDPSANAFPQVWLSPDIIQQARVEAGVLAKQRGDKKKEAKMMPKNGKKNQIQQANQFLLSPGRTKGSCEEQAPSSSTKKKGIAARKNREVVDDVTQAAASMRNAEGALDFVSQALMDKDGLFDDLDLDEEEFGILKVFRNIENNAFLAQASTKHYLC